MQEDKQIFTTHSFKEELVKKIKGFVFEVKEVLGINVGKNSDQNNKVTNTPKGEIQKNENLKKVESIEESFSPIPAPTINYLEKSVLKPKRKVKEKKSKLKRVAKENTEFKLSKEIKEKMILIFLGVFIIGIVVFAIISSFKHLRINPKDQGLKLPQTQDVFCGGVANIQCQSGFYCKPDGKYPDAGGKCVKTSVLNNL